jgi:hypothetical protein
MLFFGSGGAREERAVRRATTGGRESEGCYFTVALR